MKILLLKTDDLCDRSEHRAPVVRRSFVIQVAFHGLWISPVMGIAYWLVYSDWCSGNSCPHYVLGVYEHCMSAYELVSNAIVLRWFLVSSQAAARHHRWITGTALRDRCRSQQPLPEPADGGGGAASEAEVAAAKQRSGLDLGFMNSGVPAAWAGGAGGSRPSSSRDLEATLLDGAAE